MKIDLKKQLSLFVCLVLVMSMVTPVPIYGEGDAPTLVLSPAYLTKSQQDQTVTMEIRLPVDTKCKSFNYNIVPDDNIQMVSAAKDRYDTIYERTGGITDADKHEEYVIMDEVTYLVPANTVGEYTLQITGIELHDGTASYLQGGSAEVTLVVSESAGGTPTQGTAVSLAGPTTAVAGRDVIYTVQVSGDSYSSAQIKLAYDPALLTFQADKSSESVSAGNGTVNIVDYGASKTTPQQYTVAFTAAANGTATTTLTAAAFGTSGSAVGDDLTAATIDVASVTTVISKASFSVTLPQDVSGNASVGYADSYTFKLNDFQPTKYQYEATATMDGQQVPVTDNKDGSYTIQSVTGDLVITVTKTPRQYIIAFKSNTISEQNLPVGGSVTYGTDYKFTIPTETGCTLAVTTATIGGGSYSCPPPVNGVVTIPGEAITGNIEITIERITATVTVNGSGAGDAEIEQTATVGSEYTFKLNKAEGYTYTVTATMDGAAVSLTENNGSYTIESVTGPIVITVQKTVIAAGADVTEYIALDGKSAWLVKIACDQMDKSVYTYNGTKMFWSEGYEAYCCLVISNTQPEITNETLAVVSGSAEILTADCDVNRSGTVDANDAQLVYDLYMGTYTNFDVVSMNKFLLADTNHSGMVETNDAIVVVDEILKQ